MQGWMRAAAANKNDVNITGEEACNDEGGRDNFREKEQGIWRAEWTR